jgi:hypothetical protein
MCHTLIKTMSNYMRWFMYVSVQVWRVYQIYNGAEGCECKLEEEGKESVRGQKTYTGLLVPTP